MHLSPPVTSARLVVLARRPWPLETTAGRVVVRGAAPKDLGAVAAMHGRCSGATLMQRYRAGGRAPSLATVSAVLAEPLTVVALTGARQVAGVATARLTAEPRRDWTTEIALEVEDARQGLGIGSALALHLAATLRCLGYGQVSTRSATSSLPLTHVMLKVGDTRASWVGGVSTLTSRLQVSVADALGGGFARGAALAAD